MALTITPSSSAYSHSPGVKVTPPKLTGMSASPALFFTVFIGWVSIAVQAQPLARDASTDDTFRKQAEQHSVGPAVGPRANMTSFAPALRCMDSVFRTYGAKDVSVIVEDIPDATSKVKVGAKDMFISATSQMTRGTRAIRLIPWDKGAIYSGRDDILKGATFAIQGSISQFDETMLRKQREGAVCLVPICLGAADSDSFSGMSLDLNVVETQGLKMCIRDSPLVWP